jgi:hypothetical protein
MQKIHWRPLIYGIVALPLIAGAVPALAQQSEVPAPLAPNETLTDQQQAVAARKKVVAEHKKAVAERKKALAMQAASATQQDNQLIIDRNTLMMQSGKNKMALPAQAAPAAPPAPPAQPAPPAVPARKMAPRVAIAPEPFKKRFFDKLDTNFDEVVTREEFLRQARLQFEALDRNHNGKLTRDEIGGNANGNANSNANGNSNNNNDQNLPRRFRKQPND